MWYTEGVSVYSHNVDVVVVCDGYTCLGSKLGSSRVMRIAVNDYVSVCLFLADACNMFTFATYGLSAGSFSSVARILVKLLFYR